METTYVVRTPDGSIVASFNGEHLGDDTARALAHFTASTIEGALVSGGIVACATWTTATSPSSAAIPWAA